MSAAASSSKKIRLLVVGVGSIGERHVRCFLATGRASVGICEPNETLRSKIASTYAVEGVYSDLAEALKQPWDSVLIATPAHTHIPLTRQAVEAGVKAALIEKPLSTNEDGVSELMTLVKAKGVKAAVAYVGIVHPALIEARNMLRTGKLGEPVQLSCVSGQHFPFYRPAFASTYYARHASGGGSIQDALTHMINTCQWLVGPITRLACLASNRVLPTKEVEDTVNLLAEHGNVAASYSQNQHQPVNETYIMVCCTKGAVKYAHHDQTWSYADEMGGQWKTAKPVNFERDGWFIEQANTWLDCVEKNTPPYCTLDEALATLRVNQAALASARQHGAWIEVAQR